MIRESGYITELYVGGGGGSAIAAWTDKQNCVEIFSTGEQNGISLLNAESVSLMTEEEFSVYITPQYSDPVYPTELAEFQENGLRCYAYYPEETDNSLVGIILTVNEEIGLTKPASITVTFEGGCYFDPCDYFHVQIDVLDESGVYLGSGEMQKDWDDPTPFNDTVEISLDYEAWGSAQLKKIRIFNRPVYH